MKKLLTLVLLFACTAINAQSFPGSGTNLLLEGYIKFGEEKYTNLVVVDANRKDTIAEFNFTKNYFFRLPLNQEYELLFTNGEQTKYCYLNTNAKEYFYEYIMDVVWTSSKKVASIRYYDEYQDFYMTTPVGLAGKSE
jgi:hypothetical protein